MVVKFKLVMRASDPEFEPKRYVHGVIIVCNNNKLLANVTETAGIET